MSSILPLNNDCRYKIRIFTNFNSVIIFTDVTFHSASLCDQYDRPFRTHAFTSRCILIYKMTFLMHDTNIMHRPAESQLFPNSTVYVRNRYINITFIYSMPDECDSTKHLTIRRSLNLAVLCFSFHVH